MQTRWPTVGGDRRAADRDLGRNTLVKIIACCVAVLCWMFLLFPASTRVAPVHRYVPSEMKVMADDTNRWTTPGPTGGPAVKGPSRPADGGRDCPEYAGIAAGPGICISGISTVGITGPRGETGAQGETGATNKVYVGPGRTDPPKFRPLTPEEAEKLLARDIIMEKTWKIVGASGDAIVIDDADTEEEL